MSDCSDWNAASQLYLGLRPLAAEMAQRLWVLTASCEDLGWIPQSHVVEEN